MHAVVEKCSMKHSSSDLKLVSLSEKVCTALHGSPCVTQPFISQVFLCQGNVHLIPFPTNPAELATLPAGTPSLSRALALVRDGGIATVATSPVQEAIRSRISRYVCVHLWTIVEEGWFMV